jgi:hypothetical protein
VAKKKPKKAIKSSNRGRKSRELLVLEEIAAAVKSVGDDTAWLRVALREEIDEKLDAQRDRVNYNTDDLGVDGLACPHCGGRATGSFGDVDALDGGAELKHPLECHDCGKTWMRVYKLIGWEATG